MGSLKAKVSIRQVDHGLDKLKRVLEDLKHRSTYVKIGVVGQKGNAAHEGGLSNAQLAAIHEYGVPGRIPERSFIRKPFAAKRSRYILDLRTLLEKVYTGKMSVERAMGLMGARISADLKNGVTQGAGIPPPNAPETIKRKGSDRPLVDTGQLVNSITWAVVLKGGE